MIDIRNIAYSTTVYRKPTDTGRCLNAKSECPDMYKTSVVRAYIRRTYKNCSNWSLFHKEVVRFKQILVNNGYNNSLIDKEVRFFLNRVNNTKTTTYKEIINENVKLCGK